MLFKVSIITVVRTLYIRTSLFCIHIHTHAHTQEHDRKTRIAQQTDMLTVS